MLIPLLGGSISPDFVLGGLVILLMGLSGARIAIARYDESKCPFLYEPNVNAYWHYVNFIAIAFAGLTIFMLAETGFYIVQIIIAVFIVMEIVLPKLLELQSS